MKTTSSHHSNQPVSNLFNTDNCNCICHYPDDIEIDEEENINLHKTEEYNQSPFQKKLFQKKIQKVSAFVTKNVPVLVILRLAYVVLVSKKKKLIIIKIYILK